MTHFDDYKTLFFYCVLTSDFLPMRNAKLYMIEITVTFQEIIFLSPSIIIGSLVLIHCFLNCCQEIFWLFTKKSICNSIVVYCFTVSLLKLSLQRNQRSFQCKSLLDFAGFYYPQHTIRLALPAKLAVFKGLSPL